MKRINKVMALSCLSSVTVCATTITFNGADTQNGYFTFTGDYSVVKNNTGEEINDFCIKKVSMQEDAVIPDQPQKIRLIIPGSYKNGTKKYTVSIAPKAFEYLGLDTDTRNLLVELSFQENDSQYVNFPQDLSAMFQWARVLRKIDLGGIRDRTDITNTNSMFAFCSNLHTINLGNLNTQNVTDMGSMFACCSNLKVLNLENLGTGKVTNMSSMFSSCYSLINLDLSNFNTSNVSNMSHMFNLCSSLIKLDLTKFDTGKVSQMEAMFSRCKSLIDLNLSTFNTSNVSTMHSMFEGCNSLVRLDLSSFDTRNVSDISMMFKGCSCLTRLDLTNFDTQKVAKMKYILEGCNSLIELEISDFNKNSIKYPGYDGTMLRDCNSLTLKNYIKLDESAGTQLMYYPNWVWDADLGTMRLITIDRYGDVL